MGLDTNFNQNPYFDDFDIDKDFHKILFKPAVAVQARELTQLQTILQNQIERFGDNILKEGTIVKGCNFNFINRLPYVKVRDLQTDGSPVVMSNYVGARAIGTVTGVEAFILDVRTGFETQTPDLNTLYVKYVASSGSNKTFSATETITIENFDTGAEITTLTAAGTVTGESVSAVGTGVGLKVGDGIIYQKGAFVRVEQQLTIVEKYSTNPNGVAVGFTTNETIINSYNDTSILDNAQGFNNENAPGADRLKLTPTLTVTTVALANADPDFFTLLEYSNGNPVKRKQSTQYSLIGEEFARRTAEESGNYVVKNFPLSITDAANTSFLKARIGSGLAYVDGNRVETFGTIDVAIPVADDSISIDAQNVTTNIGHYVIGSDLSGSVPFNQISSVELFNSPQNSFGIAASNTSTANGISIGTAKIRSIEYNSGNTATATGQYKLYMFDIRMSNTSFTFADTKSVVYEGTPNFNIDLVLENSKAVIKDFSFKKTFWNVGQSSLKTIPSATADFVYRTVNQSLTVSTGGECPITLGAGEVWPYGASATLNSTQRSEIVLISNETQSPYTSGKAIDLSTATITTDVTGTTLTITGLSVPAAAMDVIAYYNVKKQASAPAEKVSTTVYVKVQANTNPGGVTGTYSLGLPDVYNIVGVYQASNTDVTEADTDVTSSFRLYPNQKDAYYDLSYVKKARSLTIGADDVLLFKVKVFKENNSGGFGDGYFSIDSYTGINLQDIPTYKSESGKVYDLRDVVDFRPFCTNTVVYATTIGTSNTALVAVGDVVTFPSGEQYVPAPNENMEIDYEYYIPRQDRLIVDGEGRFKLIEGVSDERPVVPSAPDRGMTLATIYVPPYPSLSSLVANRAGKPSYATKMSPETIHGYTMQDIGRLDRRIKQLEYYTVLNALETNAKDTAILDENGLDRFKNGIFTDSFEDLSVGDVKSSEFSAAIDPSYKELTPKISQFDIDLKLSANSNATLYNESGIASLYKTDTDFITQPYATGSRVLAGDFYKFSGKMFLFPKYDAGFDVTTAPDYNLDIDFGTPFVDFAEALNQFVPLQQVNPAVITSRSISEQSVDPITGRSGTLTTTERTSTQTIRQLQVGFNLEQKVQVGDFVTDVRFNPFMRARELKVYATGLRPLTTYHMFFDGTNVDADIAPATFTNNQPGVSKNFVRSGEFGAAITSDSRGRVRAIFRIPKNTYYVGDRRLEILDVSTYFNKPSSISSAAVTYSAFNYSVEKRSLNLGVRAPEFDNVLTTSMDTVVRRAFQPDRPVPFIQTDSGEQEFNIASTFEAVGGEGNGGGGGDDPIAQSFFISKDMSSSDSVVYATKLDLYFYSKASNAGVTVSVREMENGILTQRTVPFSKVRLEPEDITANSTVATTATTVTFDAPLALKTEQEYAFVVKPDGNDPNYSLWTAKTGGTDVDSNISITQDANPGLLFSSTNDRTWNSHQDENIKYTLYRANFSANSGYLELTNKNSEYLTVNSVSGTFNNDEYVFVNSANLTGTISMTSGNTTILGTTTTFSSTFGVGSHIVLFANTTTYDVLEILSVTNNTVMIAKDVPKYTNTAANFFKSIVGTVALFDSNEPVRLFLDNSTANTGSVFAAADVLIGHESKAQATIETVDNKNISFIAPNIYRTNTTQTQTRLSATRLFRDDISANYTKGNIEFNNNTFLNGASTVIKSRSNEITDTDTDRSFKLKLNMYNNSGGTTFPTSPIVDIDTAMVKVYEYIINNSATDEDSTDGAAETKYISRIVRLADGLDAEDLRIYLTAYRPSGTTINVYGKFLSGTDPFDFVSKPWTILTSKASNPYSQNNNRFDFKEHEFNIPTAERVAGEAYLNASGIFEYVSDGATYNNYKYFAIKIVLLSTDHHKVPRVSDMRAIALSG